MNTPSQDITALRQEIHRIELALQGVQQKINKADSRSSLDSAFQAAHLSLKSSWNALNAIVLDLE